MTRDASLPDALPYLADGAVILFDDIAWSPGMRKAWAEIVADERVVATIDLHAIGIALLKKNYAKKETFKMFLGVRAYLSETHEADAHPVLNGRVGVLAECNSGQYTVYGASGCSPRLGSNLAARCGLRWASLRLCVSPNRTAHQLVAAKVVAHRTTAWRTSVGRAPSALGRKKGTTNSHEWARIIESENTVLSNNETPHARCAQATKTRDE